MQKGVRMSREKILKQVLNHYNGDFYALHGFNDNVYRFPIVLKANTEQESIFITNYLTKDRLSGMSAVDIFIWCKSHNINCHIFFPERKLILLFKCPKAFIQFLKTRKLNY